MISAHRTGMAAGSNTARQQPNLLPNAQRIAAQEEIARRKRLNIAHFIPEEEFIQGFIEGYSTHIPLSDGLILASERRSR
jgi:hypothetical protein